MMKNQLKKRLKIRKLTKNEKSLLTILGLVILILLAYRFIIGPQREKIDDLARKKVQYEDEIAIINRILKNEENIIQEWDKLHRERDLIFSKYFPSLNQPEIIYLLNQLLSNEDVEITDMGFGSPKEEVVEDLAIRTMDISIPYKGNYTGLKEIIESLETSPKKIQIPNLIMDRDGEGQLVGRMELKFYSLEGIADIEDEIAYVDIGNIQGKSNPFLAFDDYVKEDMVEDSPEEDRETGSLPGERIGPVEGFQTEILEDFEAGGVYFLPSHDNVKGRVSKSSNSKSEKHTLRLEYNILAVEDENKAYVDLSDRDIILKYPPSNLGLWVHAYSYSPGILGIRFKGQAGEEIDVEMARGINWMGWDYLEMSPPADLSLYPLQVDKIYLELSYYRDDYGVLLLDKLEANYPRSSNKLGASFSFYIVEKGDSLDLISQKVYGTSGKINSILKYNDIKSDKDLGEGRILIIPR